MTNEQLIQRLNTCRELYGLYRDPVYLRFIDETSQELVARGINPRAGVGTTDTGLKVVMS